MLALLTVLFIYVAVVVAGSPTLSTTTAGTGITTTTSSVQPTGVTVSGEFVLFSSTDMPHVYWTQAVINPY